MNLQNLLDKYNIKIDINTVLGMWSESHRHFHNLDHLNDLISQINEKYFNDKISEKIKDKLTLVALFHDIIYDPKSNQNEEKSAELFLSSCQEKNNPDVKEVYQAILDTKSHQSTTKLSEAFNQMDMNIVERDFRSLLEWEQGIYEEYKIFGIKEYKKGRLKFLESILDKYTHNTENLLKLIDYVRDNY